MPISSLTAHDIDKEWNMKPTGSTGNAGETKRHFKSHGVFPQPPESPQADDNTYSKCYLPKVNLISSECAPTCSLHQTLRQPSSDGGRSLRIILTQT